MIPFGLTSLMTVSLPIARRATKCLVPGASAVYLFNEGAGTTLYDRSGNAYDGTLGAAAAAPTWGATGLTFDGGDYVTVPADIDAGATALTVTVVANVAAGANKTIFSKQTGTDPSGKLGWGIAKLSTQNVYTSWVYDGSGARKDPDVSGPAPGSFACITLVVNGTAATLYSATTAGSPVACVGLSLAPAQLGTFGALSYWTGGLPLAGTIAAATVYPTALTPAQIAQNYAALKALLAPRGVTLA